VNASVLPSFSAVSNSDSNILYNGGIKGKGMFSIRKEKMMAGLAVGVVVSKMRERIGLLGGKVEIR
jgi:hypothetical protein